MELSIEKIQLKDVLAVSQLIERSFLEAVAPTLTKEGVSTFRNGLTPESIKKRLAQGNLFIVCRSELNIVGVGEVRDNNHINLLFVEPAMQRKGIGRKLLRSLIHDIPKNKVTVNASLNAVNAYKRFGFEESGPENDVRGICYQPMVFEIQQKINQ